jgi:hypothetical protein
VKSAYARFKALYQSLWIVFIVWLWGYVSNFVFCVKMGI